MKLKKSYKKAWDEMVRSGGDLSDKHYESIWCLVIETFKHYIKEDYHGKSGND